MRKLIERAKPGDVCEVRIGAGVAYLHFLGTHAKYGDAVLVSQWRKERATSITGRLFSDGYIAFYPIVAASSQGLVTPVGHLPPAPVPVRLRRAGARSGRDIVTWIVQDHAGETVKRQLSDAELQLPIASIWNHALLTERIAGGWNPARIGRIHGPAQPGDHEMPADAPQTIAHYLYLPSKSGADTVAATLRERGFQTDTRLGADESKWLVVARHQAVSLPERMQSIREPMEELAEENQGEYDGWEAEAGQ